MSKKLLTSLTIATVVFSLVGCSTGTNEADAPNCAATESGESSEKVNVSGDVGSAPKVEFDSPLNAETTERTVVDEGDGDVVAVEGSIVTVDFSAYNATSGDEIETTTYDEAGQQQFTLDEAQLLPGLLKALQCSVTGDRVVAVIPPADAFQEAGQADLGVAAEDSMVFVIDVVDISEPVEALPRAEGEEQPAEDGFPTVELAEDGAPTITIPDAEAPTELKIANLITGDGEEVAEGANVTVHYTGMVWATGDIFDSSWERGEPATFPTGGVIPGFSKALVGQKVGSQVIAVIPPAEGYGDAPPEGSPIGATDTLVFVVDILATQ
ncbi:FKBP-type peptidyl-prolyl cis-trans isomerase [Marisediminicola antarctica]|uniref:peptidylprolyl isomerase n=1 Tax=Marisediminicola antarctica TaxID=674079 RepID=A0A7L5AGM1_9MICO|nr:FKBP-type peptidyl-prolyl cis-trans isomerase [Marisediminicola antarctica]QHO69680.1 peptidylprolyl isomerase [Marisediminicola antarctica]